MHITLKILIFLSLMLLIPTAGAENAPPPADIRCVIVAMQISISNDANQRTGGNMLAMYYVGRLDQYPAKVLEDAIFKELPTMTPDLFKSEADRCGRILMGKGQVLTQIGNSISSRAKELQEKQSPAPENAPAAPSPATPPPVTSPPAAKPGGK
jgi:hypothetical protein